MPQARRSLPGGLLAITAIAGGWQLVASDYFPFKGDRALYPRVEPPLEGVDGATTEGTGAEAGAAVTRHSQLWQPPLMQPWEPLRATDGSITVTWTPGWNPWCDMHYYELQARRPSGHALVLADRASLQLREADMEADRDFEDRSANADELWTPWETVYSNRSRVFALAVEPGCPPAAQFRVRACGRHDPDGCSEWSPVQTAHTVLSAKQDRINFHIRATGKNAHNYTVIEIDQRVVYRRRDETGLVLAVFSRLDFSLQWLHTYDTHRDRAQAVQMAADIRKFNHTNFVVVASAIAWEWRAAQALVKTMEYCGAYHFGQWANIFAEHKHYGSDESDLQQDASQAEFGHPYAFIGIPGIGTGNGWESLMFNTGQYMPKGVYPQDAVIRGISYYDYVHRLYRMWDVKATKTKWYMKAEPPGSATFHNPVPEDKQALDERQYPLRTMRPIYLPYVGTLASKVFHILEANETVPPYNYAFTLVTTAQVRYIDPRPRHLWTTEIERIWEGLSARYWAHNGSVLQPGLALEHRSCVEFILHGFNFASPELCGDNFTDCCDKIDEPDLPIAACHTGIAPTLCKFSEAFQLENVTDVSSVPPEAKWPYDFRIIDWES